MLGLGPEVNTYLISLNLVKDLKQIEKFQSVNIWISFTCSGYTFNFLISSLYSVVTATEQRFLLRNILGCGSMKHHILLSIDEMNAFQKKKWKKKNRK